MFGIVEDDAFGVGDVDAEVDAFLVYSGDIGLRAAPDGGPDRVGEAALPHAPSCEFRRRHFGEDMGGIDQGLFGGLADAGFGLAGEDVEDKPGS